MPAACPNCGRGINRGDQFCDSCGAFLGWDAGASAESQLLPQRGPQADDQRAAVQLQLQSDLISVAPGSAESTSFTVKNLGTQVEEFRFVVAGPEWIVASPPVLSVYPGQEATGAIQAAPPRKPGSLAGIAPFRLTATSAVHFQVSSSVAGRVDVAPYYELAADLVPTSGTGRGLTRHHITLDNRGNVPLRIMLHPTDVADGLRLGVPAFADVAPGRVTEVPVTVYASRRWLGRPEPRTFSIIAEAPQPLAAMRLSGTRTVIPVFPSWVPLAAAGLVVVAAAGATVATQFLGHHGAVGPSPSATSPSPASPSPASPSPSPSPSSPSPSPSSTSPSPSPSSTSPSPLPPAVTSVSPSSGKPAGGTPVTITGTGLSGATSVTFGSAVATITADSSTQITVTSPPGTGTVNITVTTASGTVTAADRFAYITPPPVVTTVLPAAGTTQGGVPVTITGTDLNGATSVTFGSRTGTITADSSTQIIVTSPPGQGTVDITVTTPSGTSAITTADRFTYNSPVGALAN